MGHSPLKTTAAAGTLLLGLALGAGATGATTFDLRRGAEDIRLSGAGQGDKTGHSVAFGDINGDGRADAVIGAPGAGFLGRNGSGVIYLVLSSDTLGSAVDLTAVRSDLKRIAGATDGAGIGGVIACGDVNGDGADDIVCGQPLATVNGKWQAGSVIVVYGASEFPDTFDLASPPGPVTRIQGENQNEKLGSSVSVGRVDGDAFGDVIAGAPLADTPAGLFSGKAFLVYGAAELPAVIDLASVPTGVIRIFGEGVFHNFGTACAARDMNADGHADLLIGAPQASPLGRQLAGAAYVVPGGPALPDSIHTSNPPAGVTRILGARDGDLAGTFVTCGDATGDHIGDAVVAAPSASPGGRTVAGAVYLIPGSPTWPDTVDLASPPAGVGRFDGPAPNAKAGRSLAVGDLNFDTVDDIVIGAPDATPAGRSQAGEVFIVFGRSLFPPALDLGIEQADLTNITGASSSDRAGGSVAAGRANGDGYFDLLVGAENASADGRPSTGAAYALFGSPDITPVEIVAYHGSVEEGRVRLEWFLAHDLDPLVLAVTREGPPGHTIELSGNGIARTEPGGFVLYDGDVQSGITYSYTVMVVEPEAHTLFRVSVTVPASRAAVLFPTSPNPFRNETTISFHLPEPGSAAICVYDVRGALVADFGSASYGEGRTELSWRARANDNRPLPTGIYFVTMRFEGRTLRQKVLLLH